MGLLGRALHPFCRWEAQLPGDSAFCLIRVLTLGEKLDGAFRGSCAGSARAATTKAASCLQHVTSSNVNARKRRITTKAGTFCAGRMESLCEVSVQHDPGARLAKLM